MRQISNGDYRLIAEIVPRIIRELAALPRGTLRLQNDLRRLGLLAMKFQRRSDKGKSTAKGPSKE